MKNFLFTTTAVIFVILAYVLISTASIIAGMYIGIGFGYLIELITGDSLINMINYVLNINHLEKGDLGKIFGIITAFLAFLTSFGVVSKVRIEGQNE